MATSDTQVNELRRKRDQWMDCLDGEDVNSIRNQLSRMTWNVTAFRVLMEGAVPLAPEAEGGGKQVNGLLPRLLQASFSESLTVRLRSLIGGKNDRLDGQHGVYSICPLLADISSNSHLLTRDVIIRLGPPDRVMEGRNRREFLPRWEHTKNILIDELAGVAEDRRSSVDRIPSRLFDDCHATLVTQVEKVKTLVNKTIAHPATPDSRAGYDYDGILWGHLYDIHAELCKTAHFLQDLTSESGFDSFLAVPLGGRQFQHLWCPIVAEHDIQKLEDRWAMLSHQYRSWRNWRPAQVTDQSRR